MKVFQLPFFTIALALLCSFAGLSQQAYQEEYIRFYQGLPSDIVQKTQTDAKGFLYVSTQRGLSLYDGYRFVTNADIKSGISGLLYHKGQLYFHDNLHGLAQIAAIHDKPRSIIRNNYEDIYPNNDHFENIFIDSGERLWCTDFNNIKCISKNGKTKSYVYDAKNNSINNGVSFVEPINGHVWVFTHKGLFIWNEKDRILKKHPNAEIGNLSYLSAFKPDAHRIFFALEDGRIGTIDIPTHRISWLPKLPDGNGVLGFGMLANKNLLVYSRQHVYAMTTDSPDYTLLFTASQAQINHVLVDKHTHLIWVSTNKGLVKLTPIESISNYKFPNATGSGNKVVKITEASDGTLYMLDSKNKIWSFGPNKQWNQLAENPEALQFQNIQSIDKTIFVATDRGLYELKNLELQKIELSGLPAAPLKKVILTKSRELWLLYASVPTQRYSWPSRIKLNTPFANDASFWNENTWNDLFENIDGTIWIGGWWPKSYGMAFYDKNKNAFIDISDLKGNADHGQFFGDYVNHIASGGKGEVLISGYGGFDIVQANGTIRKLIDINNYPIANGHIEGIARDNSGNVIFATGDGLHVYHPQSDEIIRISQSDGLPTDDLIYGFEKLANGTFALGIDNGFTTVDIQKLLEPQTLNRLELTEIKVDGITKQTTTDIELSKDENDMSLYFSNLTFSDRQKVFYRYKFKDDTHWHSLGNNPELTLNRIVPGNYELTIEAGNSMNHWQSKTLQLEIVAHPPFYRSGLFFLLLGVAAVIVVILVNRYSVNRQLKEAQYKQKIRESEMQTLRAQMNPHFMFNTLNSINSFIIENKTEAASEYLTTFSKLMRSILEYSKSEFIPLADELQALKLYLELEAVRLEHSFDYTIDVAKKLRNDDMIKVPPLILQPFVENAIWHGLNHKPSSGNLYITVKENDGKLTIRIEDDGIGRQAARKLKKQQTSHKSYGIEITQQRILMLHPENTVEIVDLEENNAATGTAVIIILKM